MWLFCLKVKKTEREMIAAERYVRERIICMTSPMCIGQEVIALNHSKRDLG